MRILILGGSGFIGRNIKEGIVGHDIIAPTHNEVDVLNIQSLSTFFKTNGKFDILIYCVSIHENVLHNTITAFFNTIKFKDYFKKVVYFGSWAELNRNTWHENMCESVFQTEYPSDEYGIAKRRIATYIQERLDVNIVNLRLFGVIGKYDNRQVRFIPDIHKQMSLGETIQIQKNQTMDIVSVDDVVSITQFFIEAEAWEYKDYNVCTGTYSYYNDIVNKIGKINNKKLKIVTTNNKNISKRYGNNRRLLAKIPWFRFTSINDALKNSNEWYRETYGQIG